MTEGAGSPSQPPVENQGSASADTSKQAFVKAIYGQESSHGAADTSKVNYAGAIGPMQMIRETFDGMKRNGQIPQWADFNNPNDTRRAGEIHAEYLFDKYNGDVRKAGAAYYGGEKAVKPDGTIAVFGDLKNPKAPTTVQYADAILARMGKG